MALLNIFKKKKSAKNLHEVKSRKVKTVEAQAKPKRISEIAYRVLQEPHVTEKATDATRNNQYIFKVYPRANKNDIKKSVEDVYGVEVVSVRIINIHGKRKRLGRTRGWSSGYKKAMVKLAEGQKIEVLPR